MRFLSSKAALTLTILLAIQGAVYYAVAARPELTSKVAPLQSFPAAFDGWRMSKDLPIEKEVQDVLKADDTLNRTYENPSL